MQVWGTIRKAAFATLAALALSGCTLSAALRHDEIRSVWGSGRNLPAPTVFFATDREPDGDGFSLAWGGTPRCGRAVVPIANAVSPARPDPKLEHIGCASPAQITAFIQAVAAEAKSRNCDRVLVIVHGFNLTFHNGLLHGSQIAMDTQWRCATLLLNWASEGMFNRYAADIERSGYVVPLMMELLRRLNEAGLKVDVLGHSMGARIALSAIGSLCPEPRPLVNQLVLMAPDVGADPKNDDFRRIISYDVRCVARATVYASDYDLALMASESVHGGVPRAGQQPLQNLSYEDARIDAVDATFGPGDPSGHAYFVFAYEALTDLMWVLDGASLQARAEQHGTLACQDYKGSLCAAGGGRYLLKVADDRKPSLSRRVLRAVWPLLLPFQ
jgi:esterase/lipase superfamily enzyme